VNSDFYTNAIVSRGKIYTRGYSEGKQYFRKTNFRPSLYELNEGYYKTLDGRELSGREFHSIKASKEYVNQYKGVEGRSEIFGDFPHQYQYISQEWFKEKVNYDPNLIRVANFDIEVLPPPEGGFPYPENANGEVNAICLESENIYYVFGCGKYTPKNSNVKYLQCIDERDLLRKFVGMWNFISPDVMTGWNIEFFDIPYIVNRMDNLGMMDVAKSLSPWNDLFKKTSEQFGKTRETYDIRGVTCLDYSALYKKFTYNQQESYSLNFISHAELGEKKIDYAEYSNLHNLYEKNYELFIDYNIKDVELVKRLDEKLNLLSLVYSMAYMAKCNFADTLGTIRIWDVICYNYLREQNIIVGSNHVSDSRDFVGGYVKDPQVGRHKWVMSFDLASLYPHLIMQYNISPEKINGKLNDKVTIDSLLNKEHGSEVVDDLVGGTDCVTPNGTLYTTSERGFIPSLMDRYFTDRKAVKGRMIQAAKDGDSDLENKLQVEQMALKILLNSLYGALGNKYFRHFDVDMAESITTAGQLSIRWVERAINKYMNSVLKSDKEEDYIIAVDTDSVYVSFEKIMDSITWKPEQGVQEKTDFLDKIGSDQIQKVINDAYEELYIYTNAYEQKMDMDREAIADSSVFFAKKRYIMNVIDNEGVRYKDPKIKMMGIEAVRSSTPSVCRDALKEFIKIILNGTEKEAQDYYSDFKQKFNKTDFLNISFPRTANNIDKFFDPVTLYRKGTPIHVRGSIVYNHAIYKAGLGDRYESVENGDKIKFCYMRMPNTLQSNVIAIPSVLPPELDLEKYIDYDLQFEKSFLQPVQTMLKIIGWNHKKTISLASFFVD
jgi:DNA polymerase elongation subunit (family B)